MVDVVEYFKNTPEAQRREDFKAVEEVKAACEVAKQKMKEAAEPVVVLGTATRGRCGLNVACVLIAGVVKTRTCPHFSENEKCKKKCVLHAQNNKYVAALQEYRTAQAAVEKFWDDRMAVRQK